jgi:hypothetical protein
MALLAVLSEFAVSAVNLKAGFVVIKFEQFGKCFGVMALRTGFIRKFLAKLSFVDILMAADTELSLCIFKFEFLLSFHHMATITRSLCMLAREGEAGCIVVKTLLALTCAPKLVPILSYMTCRTLFRQQLLRKGPGVGTFVTIFAGFLL